MGSAAREEDSPGATAEFSAAFFGAGADGREAVLEESVLAASTFNESSATFIVAESPAIAGAFCGKLKIRSAAARNIRDTSVATGSAKQHRPQHIYYAVLKDRLHWPIGHISAVRPGERIS